jgi:hypothetical protein
LSQDLDTIDEFSDLYAVMLQECERQGDRLTPRIMQHILFSQIDFMGRTLAQQQRPKPDLFTLLEYGKNN